MSELNAIQIAETISVPYHNDSSGKLWSDSYGYLKEKSAHAIDKVSELLEPYDTPGWYALIRTAGFGIAVKDPLKSHFKFADLTKEIGWQALVKERLSFNLEDINLNRISKSLMSPGAAVLMSTALWGADVYSAVKRHQLESELATESSKYGIRPDDPRLKVGEPGIFDSKTKLAFYGANIAWHVYTLGGAAATVASLNSRIGYTGWATRIAIGALAGFGQGVFADYEWHTNSKLEYRLERLKSANFQELLKQGK